MLFANRKDLGLVLFCLALLSACGSPGVPLPPSLELARPVTDLRAVRKGSTVTLTWTVSTRTTDGHNIRHGGPTEICRAGEAMKQCGTPLAKLAPQKNLNEKQTLQTYTDSLANFSSTADAKFFYAVEVRNSYGKTAGLSNEVEVPAAPTLPAPQNLQSQLAADGVHLSWSLAAANVPEIPGVHFAYRIYRREVTSKIQAVAGEVPVQADIPPAFLDSAIEWENTYQYRVVVVTLVAQAQSSEQQVEGDDSPEITVVARDVFPPATPTGLQAVFSGPGQKPFIDLVWAPDTEADLAGYNVYRSESGLEAKKLNAGPIKSPAFRDDEVLPSHAYTYSVSAIDVRGNESPHSEPAEENVPAE